jgi:hypothetical protein
MLIYLGNGKLAANLAARTQAPIAYKEAYLPVFNADI